jgi:hypothetical protein
VTWYRRRQTQHVTQLDHETHQNTSTYRRVQCHTDTLVSTLPPDADYLRHLGTQVFWNREQPQLFTRRLNPNACKHLGEDVGSHLSSRDVVRRKMTLHDFIAQPEVAQVKMLHAPMVLCIACNLDCRLVVHEERRRTRGVVAKLSKKLESLGP